MLVDEILEDGLEKMAITYRHEKEAIHVLVENIVKPLLNVIDGQMLQEYGHKIDEKYFKEKLEMSSEIREKLAIPSEMLNTESAMLTSATERGGGRKAIQQFQVE
jgi:hypothetical protein